MSDTDDIRRGDYGPVAAFGQSMIDGCAIGCLTFALIIFAIAMIGVVIINR